jgi:hypothetical protein
MSYLRDAYETGDYDDTPDRCTDDCCVVDQCCLRICGDKIYDADTYYEDGDGYRWCASCWEICWSCGDNIGETNDVVVSDSGRAHTICHLLEGAQPVGRPA